MGTDYLGSTQIILNVFGFGFDVDSLCNFVRVIVCIVYLSMDFFSNNSADVNIFLSCSDIKSFVFM